MTRVYQHQMSADGRDGAHLVAACRPQAPAVVHYDTQASHHGFSLPVEMTHTSLKTGRAFGLGIFSQFLFGPLSIQAVPPAGAVAGVLPLVTAAHFKPGSRRGSRLRKQPAQFAILCICKSVQDRADALHLTRVLSKHVVSVEGKHARRLVGCDYQKSVIRTRCPK